MNLKRLGVLAAMVAATSARTAAPAAATPDLTVLCSNAFKTVFEELAPQFERASHHQIAVRYGLAARLKEQIDAGQPFDLAIMPAPTIDDLIKAGRLAAGSRTILAQSGLGLIVKVGAPKPDLSTADAFKRTLLGSKSIAYAKEGASGVAFAAIIQRLGIADNLAPKTTLTATGEAVGEAVVRGEVQYGVLPVSEILPVRGADLGAVFPADVQSYIVVVAALPAGAKDPSAGRDLIRFLAAPAALPVIKARGMERPAV